MLGSSLVPFLRECGYDTLSLSRQPRDSTQHKVDFSNAKGIFTKLDTFSPNFIVNLVALTDVDRCEKNPNEAYIANISAVEIITEWLKHNIETHFVHISTDHVYGGSGPSDESNIKIVNSYAMSKYAGELIASQVNSTILRTNFFGKSFCPSRSSFSDWVFASLKNGTEISAFDNVFFSPLSINTLIGYIEGILRNPRPGIYNIGAREGFSKADFIFKLAATLGMNTDKVQRVNFKESNVSVSRPLDMRMNCEKFETNYIGRQLPSLEQEILTVRGDYLNA